MRPRAQRQLAKAPRHRTKYSMLSRVAHRERTHEAARAEAVGEAAHVEDEGRASVEGGARRLLQIYKLVVDIVRGELRHEEFKRPTIGPGCGGGLFVGHALVEHAVVLAVVM